jgi:hypothetical protein
MFAVQYYGASESKDAEAQGVTVDLSNTAICDLVRVRWQEIKQI